MEWAIYILVLALCGASAILARNARAHARLALQESQKAIAAKDEAEQALINILDEDGNVRGRLALPGKVPEPPPPPPPPPTTTPCGDLCKHAFFERQASYRSSGFAAGKWRCRANQGIDCEAARPLFLNAETNNCVMFERDDD